MIYIVTFNPHRGLFGAAPQDLYMELIKPPTRTWWHHLNDTWLISTPERINDFYNRLAPHMVTDDRLLIVRLQEGNGSQAEYRGWLPAEAWNWIAAEINSGKLYT